jgi:hypothetical protein
MVGAPGFEPGASCAQGRRATRLRYAPTAFILTYLAPRGLAEGTKQICGDADSGHGDMQPH